MSLKEHNSQNYLITEILKPIVKIISDSLVGDNTWQGILMFCTVYL